MKIFGTRHINLVKRSLDVYSRQHEALAKNIANANDPDYKRLKTDFSESLMTVQNQQLKTSNSRHIGNTETPERNDAKTGKGSVDISREMSELAENQIRFDFVSRVLNRTYRKLNSSITGRTS
jgi:flagellar basal-body rod protein FlgB